MKAPSKTDKVNDIAERMESFREGMTALVQKYNINPQAEIQYSNTGINAGIVLVDRVHKNRELDTKARELCLKNFQDTQNAQPADIEHEATQEAVAAMIQGEGDELS